MMSEILPIIVLCALVTISVRALPIVLLARLTLPVFIRNWLGFIPSAIMAAIVAAELIGQSAALPTGFVVPSVAAAIAMLTGIVTRSLFATVFVGVGAYLAVSTWV